MLKLRKLSVLVLAMLFSIASFGQGTCEAPSDLQITSFEEIDGTLFIGLDADPTLSDNYFLEYSIDDAIIGATDGLPPYAIEMPAENGIYTFTISAFCPDGSLAEGVTVTLDATAPDTNFGCPVLTNVSLIPNPTATVPTIDISWLGGTDETIIEYLDGQDQLVVDPIVVNEQNYSLELQSDICIHKILVYTKCGDEKSLIYCFIIPTVDDVKLFYICCDDFWDKVDSKKSWMMFCNGIEHAEGLPPTSEIINGAYVYYKGTRRQKIKFKELHFEEVELENCEIGAVIDTLIVNINDTYVNVQPNSSIEINPLENSSCSNPESPDCADLLNSLSITDFTQPEFGTVILEGNMFVYTPNLDYQGYDIFSYTVILDDGTLAFGLVYINTDIDILPFPLPCLYSAPFPTPFPTPSHLCPIEPNCGLLCNSNIGTWAGNGWSPYLSNGTTPSWRALQGNPRATTADIFGLGCGAIQMWRLNDNSGTATTTKLKQNVTPNHVYLLTYTRDNLVNTSDEFVTRLDNSTISTNFFSPSSTASSFVIDTDPNIGSGTLSQRVANCFVPTGTYDNLTMYPRQTTNANTMSFLRIDQIELVEYPLPTAYAAEEIECGETATLTAPVCQNSSTTWEWYEASTNNLLGTGNTYTTTPITQVTTIDLRLSITADIVNCGPTEISYTYTYTPINCCCDDFVNMIHNSPISANIVGTNVTFTPPSGIQANDNVYWDFNCDGINDNTSQGNVTVPWTYPSPGNCNYVACMTAEHIQADGDTCRAKQTKFITLEENCQPTQTCCNCDDEFYNDVDLGFTSFFNGLTGSFAPIGDFDQTCDNVEWIWNDTTPNDNTLGNQSITHTFPNDGIYNVCMIVYRDTDQDGEFDCMREYCTELEVVTCTAPISLWETDLTCNGVVLHWNAVPNAQAYQMRGGKVGNTLTIFPQTTATFKTVSGGLQSNTSYQWTVRTKCDGVWTDWYSPDRVFTTPVCRTSQYNPKNDPFANKTDDFFKENLLDLYPNPTQNDLYVKFNSTSAEKTTLKVVDIFGKTILEKSIELQKGDNDFQLQVQNFKAGTYFLEIETEKGKTTKKFFVL